MRFKILIVIFLALLLVCLAFMGSNTRVQMAEINTLRERVYNLEVIIHREVVGRKQSASLPDAEERTKPDFLL